MGYQRTQENADYGFLEPDELTEFYSAHKKTFDRTFFKMFIDFCNVLKELTGTEVKLLLVICAFMTWRNHFRFTKKITIEIMTYMSLSKKTSLDKIVTSLCKKNILKRIEPKTYEVSEKITIRREEPFKYKDKNYFFKVYDDIFKIISLPTGAELKLLLVICSFMSWNNTIVLDTETTNKIMSCLSITNTVLEKHTLSLCKKDLLERIKTKTYKVNEALFTKQAEPHIKRQRQERQKKEQELMDRLLLKNTTKYSI